MDLYELKAWLTEHLPQGLYLEPPQVLVDEEILILGRISDEGIPADAPQEERDRLAMERILAHREETREARMEVARQLQGRVRRNIVWGARCGQTEAIFTSRRVPVMTRLDRGERRILDLLIQSGVCSSRSEALAWCVRAIAARERPWFRQLRDAVEQLQAVRQQLQPDPLADVEDRRRRREAPEGAAPSPAEAEGDDEPRVREA